MNQDLYNHNLVGSPSPILVPTTWVRNSEWLAMPTVAPTEKKIVILFRVDPGASNYVAFIMAVTGGYTVDWGDGTSNNIATGVQANKQYDFAAVSATTTSMGYKQVLITITPTVPANNFTSINLQVKNNTASVNGYRQGHQDVIISAPTCATIILGSGSTITPTFGILERVQIIASALTNYVGQFGDLYELQSYSITSSATVTSMSNMFYNCMKLQSVGPLPYSTCTDIGGMFNRCKALRNIGVSSISTPATTAWSIFQNCTSLTYIPPITFTTATSVTISSIFNGCSALTSVPVLTWSKVNDATSVFQNCTSLTYIPALNLPLCTTLSGTFSGCYSLNFVGDITTTSVLTTLSSTFSNCYRLLTLPNISNTSNVTSMSNFAFSCYEITTIPAYDTSNVQNMTSAFQYCTLLSTLPTLSYAKCVNMSNTFNSCMNLRKTGTMNFGTTSTGAMNFTSMFQCSNSFESGIEEIGPILLPSTLTSITTANMLINTRALRSFNMDCTKMAGATLSLPASSFTSVILTGMRFAIQVAACLDATALIALFNSLGTASGAQTLTVSSNPGWANLTAADKLIATNKGFTLA